MVADNLLNQFKRRRRGTHPHGSQRGCFGLVVIAIWRASQSKDTGTYCVRHGVIFPSFIYEISRGAFHPGL